MASLLHITNGDSAADLIREAGLGGEVLAWRDPMHHGPFPVKLPLEELSRLRIAYLSDGAEGNDPNVDHGFTLRDATLARCSEYEEVVLWFEHDLLDQLQILQILDYLGNNVSGNDLLSRERNKKSTLSIICIDRFKGVQGFRGLGQLNPEQIASLFPGRVAVDQSALESAARCWDVFRQPTPLLLQEVIATDIPGLPFMRPALQRHCQEFPWVEDGLTRTERQLLNLVSAGEARPVQLFIKNMEFENFLYIGDARTYSIIETLCNGDNPLLQTGGQDKMQANTQPFKHLYSPDIEIEDFKSQRLNLTDRARQILSGQTNASEFIPRNEWLGGVQQQSAACWSWYEKNQSFCQYVTS